MEEIESAAPPPELVSKARAVLPNGAVYADWASRPLPVASQSSASKPVESTSSWVAHPHSLHASTTCMEDARSAAYRLFAGCESTHALVFTSSTTHALDLLATRLPWKHGDALVMHRHAHKSLLGLAVRAIHARASYTTVDTIEMDHAVQSTRRLEIEESATVKGSSEMLSPGSTSNTDNQAPIGDTCHPFLVLALPGVCNLTGAIYPFAKWARAAHRNGIRSSQGPSTHGSRDWRGRVITLLDAAALLPARAMSKQALDHVDVVVCSFYKLLGSPTGLGALLIRRNSLAERILLHSVPSVYFAGGPSARFVDVERPDRFASAAFADPPLVPSIEDAMQLGTPNLDAASALPVAVAAVFDKLGGVGTMQKRAHAVATKLRDALGAKRSQPSVHVVVYDEPAASGPLAMERAAIVSFSVFREDGVTPIGHRAVEQVLRSRGIYVRVGCMCNPGACAAVLRLGNDELMQNYASGQRCDNHVDVAMGKHTGVVRASFGWASLDKDALAIAEVLHTAWKPWVDTGVSVAERGLTPALGLEKLNVPLSNVAAIGRVAGLALYPLKGCPGARAPTLYADTVGGALSGGFVGDRLIRVLSRSTNALLNIHNCSALNQLLVSTAFDAANGSLQITLRRAPGAEQDDIRARLEPLSLDVPLEPSGKQIPNAVCGRVLNELDDCEQVAEKFQYRTPERSRTRAPLPPRGHDYPLSSNDSDSETSDSDTSSEGSEDYAGHRAHDLQGHSAERRIRVSTDPQIWLLSRFGVQGLWKVAGSGSSFANRGPCVHIVTTQSCRAVAAELGSGWNSTRVAQACRANIILDCGTTAGAWEEDSWVSDPMSSGEFSIVVGQEKGNGTFQNGADAPDQRTISIAQLRPCMRCPNLNEVGDVEPLATITRIRKRMGHCGAVSFGLVGKIVRTGRREAAADARTSSGSATVPHSILSMSPDYDANARAQKSQRTANVSAALKDNGEQLGGDTDMDLGRSNRCPPKVASGDAMDDYPFVSVGLEFVAVRPRASGSAALG